MGESGHSIDESADADETTDEAGAGLAMSRRRLLQQSVVGGFGLGLATGSWTDAVAAGEIPNDPPESLPDNAVRLWPQDTDAGQYCENASGDEIPSTGEEAATWFRFGGCGSWKEFSVTPGKTLYIKTFTNSFVITNPRHKVKEYIDGDWETTATRDYESKENHAWVNEYVPESDRLRFKDISYEGSGRGFYLHMWQETEPTAEIDVQTGNPTAGEDVEFEGILNGGDADSYEWDFDTGDTGSGETVTHTYESADTYEVELSVEATDGTTYTATHQLTVQEERSVDITVTPTSPIVGEEVEFDGTLEGATGDSFEWTFGDGEGDDGQTVYHTYDSHDDYMVELTITSGDTTYSTTRDLTVQEKQDPEIVNISPPSIEPVQGNLIYVTVEFKAPNVSKDEITIDRDESFVGDSSNLGNPDPNTDSLDESGGIYKYQAVYSSTPPSAGREINLGITVQDEELFSETWYTFMRHATQTGPLAVEDDTFYTGTVFKAPALGTNDIEAIDTSQFIAPGNKTASGSPTPDVTIVSGPQDIWPGELPDDLAGLESTYAVLVTYDTPPAGEGIALDMAVEADGTDVFSDSRKTFAFESVEPIDIIPTKANGVTKGSDNKPLPENDDLFEELREKAEKVNEYLASNLGTMGQEGRDFRFPTRGTDNSQESEPHVTLQNGWLELPLPDTKYDARTPPGQSEDNIGGQYGLDDVPDPNENYDLKKFPGLVPSTHAIQLVYESSEIQLSENNTTAQLVMANEPLNEYHHGGDGWTQSIGSRSGDDPEFKYHIYVPEDGDEWIHEIGHNLGLPDLYENLPWGLMSSPDNEKYNNVPGQITAYCRAVTEFGNRQKSDWIKYQKQERLSRRGPVNLDMDFLSEMDSTDTFRHIRVVRQGRPKESYIAEARKWGDSGLEHPDGDPIKYSPADYRGVPLYYAGDEDIQDHGRGGNLNFLSDTSRDDASPTLNFQDQQNKQYTHEFHDSPRQITFELTGLDNGGANVRAKQETNTSYTAKLSDSSVENALTVSISEDEEWLAQYQSNDASGTSSRKSLPPLDIVVETPDGQRAGTKGERDGFIREIDGSYVTRAGRERCVLVPLKDGLDVTISGERLVTELQERGYDVEADEIPITQDLYVEIDPEFVETDEGHLTIEGRTKRTTTHKIGGDTDTFETLVPSTIDLEPERLNVNSDGKFVTAHIGLPETGNPEEIDLSTVQLKDVPAVTDERYGFTSDPPVETRNGEDMAMVKFRRAEVLEAFEPGIHEVPVTGLTGDHTFLGTTELEIFEPGGGNGNGGNGNGGNGGNGNGNNGNNGRGNGNGRGN